MEAIGVHFDYRKEQRRSMICCSVTSVITLLPLVTVMYIRNAHRSAFDIFAIFVSRILQFGASFQFFMSFSILVRKIAIRYAVLNTFLR